MGVGATLAGKIFEIYSVKGVAIFVLIVSIFWAIWIFGMRNPNLRGTLYLSNEFFDFDKLDKLKESKKGIMDSYINESEGV